MEYVSIREEQPTHRDLRSCEKALNRQRKQSQKYYGYRGVKPSWVGQKYYTLALVPNDDPKTTPSTKSTSTCREFRNRDIYDLQFKSSQLKGEQISSENVPIKLCDEFSNWVWKTFYYDNYVTICVAEAHANGTLTHAPAALSSLECVLRDPDYCPNMASAIPVGRKIVLTLETWTKRDSFARKEVGIYPLCGRNHRGKKCRDKGGRKENAKTLGRGQRCRNGERRERDEIAGTRGEWVEEEQNFHCCETCIVHSDVDAFMEGEFQDPEEYQKAWNALWKELMQERVAEGDDIWMLFYQGDDAEGDETNIETEVDFVEDNGEDTDAYQVGALTAEDAEHESDSWSDIVFIPGTLAECDVGSHQDTDLDVMSEADSAVDSEWEVLASVHEIIWKTPRDDFDKR